MTIAEQLRQEGLQQGVQRHLVIDVDSTVSKQGVQPQGVQQGVQQEALNSCYNSLSNFWRKNLARSPNHTKGYLR